MNEADWHHGQARASVLIHTYRCESGFSRSEFGSPCVISSVCRRLGLFTNNRTPSHFRSATLRIKRARADNYARWTVRRYLLERGLELSDLSLKTGLLCVGGRNAFVLCQTHTERRAHERCFSTTSTASFFQSVPGVSDSFRSFQSSERK